MRSLLACCGLLLPLVVACGGPGKKPPPDAGERGGAGGSLGTGGISATGGAATGGAATAGRAGSNGSGGAANTGGTGQDPNKALVFIVHASNRLRDERIDFCEQKTFPTRQIPPMGPILALAGGAEGIGFGEMSVPREVQNGSPQDLLVVRAGATNCDNPIGLGAGGGNAGLTTGVVLFLQLSGKGSSGFTFVGASQSGKDAINFRDFVHDGVASDKTAQFVSDGGAVVNFSFLSDVTLVDAPASGRIIVTSPALTVPLERPYQAVAGGRSSVMLLGHGSEPENWRIVVCDHDAPARGAAVDCRDTVRQK